MRILIFLLSLTAFLFSCNNQETIQFPRPTDTIIKMDMEDGELKDVKKEWLETLFQTPGEQTADQIEAENAWNLYQDQLSKPERLGPMESIADGKILGEWTEKGSNNQSGSVFKLAHNSKTNEIYTIAAGRNLFKGNLDGENWVAQNQKLRFDTRFLEVIHLPNNSTRLIASINYKPHYSDDDCITWQPSEGFTATGGSFIKNQIMTPDSSEIYFLGKKVNNSIELMKSNDFGETYYSIHTFGESNLNNMALTLVKNSNQVLIYQEIVDSYGRIYTLSANKESVVLATDQSQMNWKGKDGNLVATFNNDTTYLYAFDNNNIIYKSTNLGVTWEEKDTVPKNIWGVGIFVSSEDPNYLLAGEVNCWESFDGGESWSQINEWFEYYGDVVNKLHADIMSFSDYHDTINDRYSIFISNHGGLSRQDGVNADPINIGLYGLNVSQYYSVRTSPFTEGYIYAGAQDQGFQRAKDKEGELLNFNQVISGDYGHIVFSNSGLNLWTVYPGGWVTYYETPEATGYKYSYELISENESVWIPPLAASSYDGSSIIYMAGGNINGGPGSHLIQLYASLDGIELDQFDFDFKDASGGEISAIALANDDASIYIATTNGKFFYSHDYGDTWNESVSVNGGQYLYGSKIIPSKNKNNIIYTGGTGYNGAAVMRSQDGGNTFSTFANGLPNTVVLDMAINAEETLLFAATNAGPYVCIIGEEQWYPMQGEAAPNTRYWSVEVLNEDQRVRFGSYGRGIWDFDISFFVDQKEIAAADSEIDANIFPNPVSDILYIESKNGKPTAINIHDMSGKLISTSYKTDQIDVANLVPGTYFINIMIDNQLITKQMIKQ